MITSLEASNNQGGLLSIPLRDPVDGIFVANIDGLDPVKADIVSSSFASMDGEQFQSSRRGKRNIVLTLGMDVGHPSKSVRQIRHDLMKFFMPKSQVTLRFYDSESPAVNIVGKIESMDAPLFTKVPGAQISVLCMDPDFYITTAITVSGETVSGTTETPLNYDGSVETGFNFELDLTDDLAGFTFNNRLPDNTNQVMDISYAFLSGDVVKICTIPGQKLVTVTRAGITSSILYSMSSTSAWATLVPGVNNIRVQADGAGIPYTITYNTKFGGL